MAVEATAALSNQAIVASGLTKLFGEHVPRLTAVKSGAQQTAFA
jgi:hypothetical protein